MKQKFTKEKENFRDKLEIINDYLIIIYDLKSKSFSFVTKSIIFNPIIQFANDSKILYSFRLELENFGQNTEYE